MGAKREEIKLLDGWKSLPMQNLRLVRQANGEWALKGDLELTPYSLCDGRTIHFMPATITVHARQMGRLPHPDPFGHKRRRTKKKS